jgi:hypothetical protein
MFSLVIRHSLIILAGSLTMLNGLAGCASSSPTASDKLDQFTGATVTYVDVPLVFYRDNPSQAAYARNFVHAGPIQVNRSGTYKYYIWLASWNTMQVTDASYVRDRLESIVIFANGEPLLLELSGWAPDDIGVSEPVYLSPAASAADAYYQVTIDQIRLIAESSDIRLRTAGPTPREFELWDEQKAAKQSLTEFLRLTQY